MTYSHNQIAVIGGGIIGLLVAHSLVERGEQVCLIEKGEIGRESSWAGGGILSPLYPWRYPDAVNHLALWSQDYYREFCAGLGSRTGVDPQWRRTGLLVAGDPGPMFSGWAKKFGGDSAVVDAQAVAALSPRLLSIEGSSVWMPHIAQVRNPRLLSALRKELEQRGCRFLVGTEAQALQFDAGRARGVETSRGVVPVSRVVIAMGAWTGRFMESLGLTVPVKPVRGQMILFRGEPGWLNTMVLKESRYLIPRADGRILAGSTLEDVGFDKSTTEDALVELRDAAIDMVPGLAGMPVETQWAGLRPGSPDGVPVISRLKGVENVVVCSGHYRNGFVLGPASARLAVELLLGEAPSVDVMPYHLDRV
ncbi:MAG: glycine oxidase ThiO [Gammaproteobacteria bacterium]|nr:glycine oxidase ThiO [Gammaproteobacteria bacterium]